MSLLRSTLLFLLLIPAGCGFSPLYAKQEEHSTSPEITRALASVEIVGLPDTRVAQEFRTRLEDLLNPRATSDANAYRLDIALKERNTPSAIQQNREITRYNIVLSATYHLYHENKPLADGVIRLNGSYDAVDSQYATFIAQQDTTHRIARELAESLKLRLLAAFEQYFATRS